MDDPTEPIRRERLAEINAEPGSCQALEAVYGQVWDTGWLVKENITEALQDPGLLPSVVVEGRR